MKMTHTCATRYALAVSGIMLGMGCPGTTILAPVRIKMFGIAKAVDIYAMNHRDKLPVSLDELAQFALNHYNYGNQPLLKREDFLDPWGEPFEYEYSGRKYIIRSAGPDREMGTADDILEGDVESYQRGWKSTETLPIDGQGTNVLQAATPEPVRPPVAIGKKTPDRVATKNTPPEDGPTETDATPWKLPLLIGVTVIVATGIWRCFRKRKST